jgi:hypothetical protein
VPGKAYDLNFEALPRASLLLKSTPYIQMGGAMGGSSSGQVMVGAEQEVGGQNDGPGPCN